MKLGNTLGALERMKEAAVEFKAALRLAPDLPSAKEGLALTRLR